MSHESLYKKASEARRLFESRSVARPLLKGLYLACNPEVEIESFLVQAEALFPRLNCGLTAVYLQHALGDGYIRNGSYDGQGHTFLTVGSTALDITADQFDGPSIYVGPLIAPWSADK